MFYRCKEEQTLERERKNKGLYKRGGLLMWHVIRLGTDSIHIIVTI